MGKSKFNITAIAAIIILSAGIGMFFGYKMPEKKEYLIPDGFSLIFQADLDSINNITPDTIVKDSIILKERIIYEDRFIKSEIAKNGNKVYRDSIVNDSTFLIITDTIDGTLLSRKIEFMRALRYRELRVPFPQFITSTKHVIDKRNFSLYIGGTILGNKNCFMAGGEGGFITSRNIQFGAILVTDMSNKYIGVSIKKIFDF
jgi:hypothetical protein